MTDVTPPQDAMNAIIMNNAGYAIVARSHVRARGTVVTCRGIGCSELRWDASETEPSLLARYQVARRCVAHLVGTDNNEDMLRPRGLGPSVYNYPHRPRTPVPAHNTC